MNIEDIKIQREQLDEQLLNALSTMEHSDRVFKIRKELKNLQLLCPHKTENFDYSTQDFCPYCGKKNEGM